MIAKPVISYKKKGGSTKVKVLTLASEIFFWLSFSAIGPIKHTGYRNLFRFSIQLSIFE